MGTIEKIVVGIVVGVATALILALLTGSPPFENNGDDAASGQESSTPDTPSPNPDPSPDPDPSPAPDPDPSPAPDPAPSGCTITIENPLVTLYEEPDRFGLEVARLPPGTYAVSDVAVVSFAGSDQRWFQTSVDGRSGWVADSTILIASKSSACT